MRRSYTRPGPSRWPTRPKSAPGRVHDPAKIKEWLESLKPGDFDRIERGKDPKNPDE